MDDPLLMWPDPLSAVLAAILREDGCGTMEAACIADHLVDASCCGHDSHGVIRIGRYHAGLRSGLFNPDMRPRVVGDLGALMQFDGGNGMGQWVARQVFEQGIARADSAGLAVISLRRAGHIGRVGAYAEMAAQAGLASVIFTNVAGSRLVAPFGTARRAGSTAPVTIGVPNRLGDDFILDFATSLVAEGKALVAAQGGAPLSDAVLVDSDGRPNRDPASLYGETASQDVPDPRAGPGALRPFGLHKGSGLMLACELLGGALTGNGTNGEKDHRFGNGLFALLIDPERLDDQDMFHREVADYLRFVQSAPPAEGVDAVRIPGDRERQMRLLRRTEGLPVAKRVDKVICDICEALSIPLPKDLYVDGPASAN